MRGYDLPDGLRGNVRKRLQRVRNGTLSGLRQRQMPALLRQNRELREMHVQGRNADRNVRDLHGVRGRLHAVGRQMRGVLPDGMFVVFFVHDLHGVRQRLLPQQRVMRRLSGKRDLRRWNGQLCLRDRI